MKERRRNAKFRVVIDGDTYLFTWVAGEDVVLIRKKGKRSKPLAVSAHQILDAALGQMTFKLDDSQPNT